MTWEERKNKWKLKEIAKKEEKEGTKVWISRKSIKINEEWWKWWRRGVKKRKRGGESERSKEKGRKCTRKCEERRKEGKIEGKEKEETENKGEGEEEKEKKEKRLVMWKIEKKIAFWNVAEITNTYEILGQTQRIRCDNFNFG